MGLRDLLKKRSVEDKNDLIKDETSQSGIKDGLKNEVTDDNTSKDDKFDIDNEMENRLKQKAGDAYKL